MSQLEAQFYRGDYRSVLESTIDSGRKALTPVIAHLVIGALSFTGRKEETKLLCQSDIWDEMLLGQQIEARFYHAITTCRHSDYQRAAKLFMKNLQESRGGSHRDRFFALQGLAFYAYFKCRFNLSRMLASRAANEALLAEFFYGRALAHDLLGHSLVQVGQVGRGLSELRQARQLAECLGSGGFVQSTKLTSQIYMAQHGILDDCTESLRKLIRTGNRNNNYSVTNLMLELSDQLLHMGQRKEAEDVHNQAAVHISAGHSLRQRALLDAKLARIAHIKGHNLEAIAKVDRALTKIDPDTDQALQLQLLSAKNGYCHDAGGHLREDEETLLQRLRRKPIRAISLRNALRRGEIPSGLRRQVGEDLLGDLMDEAFARGRIAVDKIIESGYLGLLPRALGFSSGKKTIYADPIPKTLLIVDQGQVHFCSSGFSKPMRDLLRAVSRGPKTKEQLVTLIWDYRYNPRKHDPLLYRLVSRLRHVLGDYGHWLISDQQQYRIAKDVDHILLGSIGLETPRVSDSTSRVVISGEKPKDMSSSLRVLNSRQIKIIEDQNLDFLDPKSYRETHGISSATARRDLSELVGLGVLERYGMARATVYRRCSNSYGDVL